MGSKKIGELQGGWSVLFRLSVAVLPAGFAANMMFTGWMARSITDHGMQIAAIEANRFDADDALALWRELSAVRERLAALPLHEPPQWFIDRVDRLERLLETHVAAHRVGGVGLGSP